ncbi:MAG: hypothetical protein O2960_07910 [Verrucomicrobia bacterium]|nr:hypothetical protein [Verrucomicrobiota bacterium]
MTDHFATLVEPRRPWIAAEVLKQKFLAFTSEVHPDRKHGSSESEKRDAQDRCTALNAAYQCLRDTKARLSHLLELELNKKPGVVEEIPEGMMELFFQVGKLCKAVDQFLSQKNEAASPIAKVEWFEKGLDWTEKLTSLQNDIGGRHARYSEELKAMNSNWESADTLQGDARIAMLPIRRVEEIYRVFGFTSRWSQQLQDRVLNLSF